MRLKLVLSLFSILSLSVSCIKDEPLGMEADIVDIKVDGEYFITKAISEHSVQLIVSEKADYKKLVPVIQVSDGARIEPASGISQDFADDKKVIYKVISEDGQYSKTYSITATSKISMNHTFEDWTYAGSEKYPYPILDDLLWSNANSGIVILVATGVLNIKQYPTDKTTDCVEGEYGAILQTIKGAKVLNKYYPIFAGSLFRGGFSADMDNPLKSLRLGQAHPMENGKPIYFSGYYKYKPGDVFTGKDGNAIPNRTDSMSVYAAIFKVSKGAAPTEEYLDGETIVSSSRVVGMARWSHDSKDISETPSINGFTRFVIPFKYTEDLDFRINDYRLTIVCSSSKDGNLYEGAAGSTLIVDNLEIISDL
ncbi:MAG: PCMD domain-containing protein [Prevotella sp.]|jgi:hypothetical protein|nr:PCMD domain-containing protein [Prevotella sp.]